MEDFNEVWGKIKKYWQNYFQETEVFIDENENILVFKIKEMFVILGYLHFLGSRRLSISASHFTDFIKLIINTVDKSYTPNKIFLLCNRNLSEISHVNEILTLPDDVEYYYVDYNWFYETINFKVENKIKSAEHCKSTLEFKKPWYHKKNIQVITDSRFEDWDKWQNNNYEREWYDFNEIEKFDTIWNVTSIISISEIYIDDRFIFGFYVVWKNDIS